MSHGQRGTFKQPRKEDKILTPDPRPELHVVTAKVSLIYHANINTVKFSMVTKAMEIDLDAPLESLVKGWADYVKVDFKHFSIALGMDDDDPKALQRVEMSRLTPSDVMALSKPGRLYAALKRCRAAEIWQPLCREAVSCL